MFVVVLSPVASFDSLTLLYLSESQGLPLASILNHNDHVIKADITANASIVITHVEWLLVGFYAVVYAHARKTSSNFCLYFICRSNPHFVGGMRTS